MHGQPTISSTPLVLTVNGQPLRTYLHARDPEPPRQLVGELDGRRVVWAPVRHRTSCARHPHQRGCPCVQQLGRLATPDALRGWYRGLSWQQRRHLHAATSTPPPLQATGAPPRPRREPPAWTWGLGGRLTSPPPSSASCS